MPVVTGSLPYSTDTDVARVVVDRWTVAEPSQQTSLADRILDDWAGRPFPPDLAAVSCVTATRGDVVLSLQQWTAGPVPAGTTSEAADAPGHMSRIEFVPVRGFADHSENRPECLVLVTFDFETATQATEWAGLLIDAIRTQPEPTPGCVSRRLFRSTDSRTVLNYSEWLSEDHHRDSLQRPATTAQWRRIEDFPGLTHGPGARCRLHGTVVDR